MVQKATITFILGDYNKSPCLFQLQFLAERKKMGWGGCCFLDGSVVRNLPANAGDTDSIPDLGKIPHPMEPLTSRAKLLDLCFTAQEPHH